MGTARLRPIRVLGELLLLVRSGSD